ncbi:hypothetical protein LSH36_1123g00058 [Paralvinella palmiformis]|uniref:Uncharacterized protein n=1 Tax=Paralvinella palmiformis TaxID=53620 RepID=A0AAD9IWF2_9ANNE|nr:hypothetical protein LSH36_1123g00058 [Paralvinella palmiformis]
MIPIFTEEHASIWINCQRRHISFGVTSHPRVNNTNVKGILLLPKAIHYDNSTSHDAPVKSVFIGRIGYWKQMVYKSMTKTGTELRLLRDIYSVKKPYSNILLPTLLVSKEERTTDLDDEDSVFGKCQE